MAACPFCEAIDLGRVIMEDERAAALEDAFPLSEGHTLIVPKVHEPDYFQLADKAKTSIWAIVDQIKLAIDAQFQPISYNLGINVGVGAGQTVAHAHVHLIPRYRGDTTDPRGGVRWVLPSRAAYWED